MAPKLFYIIRPSRLILALVPDINIQIQVKNTTPCTIWPQFLSFKLHSESQVKSPSIWACLEFSHVHNPLSAYRVSEGNHSQ